ncbi:hypothetical protein [Marinicella rhabdoformis]|uniref:hypothetical protein n=1 Tax=Marinicella rhabdoformis TaxID=2580566 RepID=UPI0015D039D3|nr:hypothetical protein [Marinicella rhabdoformis]
MRLGFNEYKKELFRRLGDKQISIKSIRMSLSAVTDLIKPIGMGDEFEQQHIDQHLIRKPGQKANLTGFINFINNCNKLDLKLRVDEKKANAYRKGKLQKKLVDLMSEDDDRAVERKWLLYGLQYFHSLPMRIAGSSLKNGVIDDVEEGIFVNWNDKKYFIPNREGLSETDI